MQFLKEILNIILAPHLTFLSFSQLLRLFIHSFNYSTALENPTCKSRINPGESVKSHKPATSIQSALSLGSQPRIFPQTQPRIPTPVKAHRRHLKARTPMPGKLLANLYLHLSLSLVRRIDQRQIRGRSEGKQKQTRSPNGRTFTDEVCIGQEPQKKLEEIQSNPLSTPFIHETRSSLPLDSRFSTDSDVRAFLLDIQSLVSVFRYELID